jgi:hypothetical protein
MCPDTQRSASTRCQYPGCTNTVWKDPDGSYSSFCGNTHRLAMASNPRSQSRLCKVGQLVVFSGHWHRTDSEVKELQCKARFHRKWTGYVIFFFDSGCGAMQEGLTSQFFFSAHDFCGRRCAEQFNNNGWRSSQPRVSPPPSENMCIMPGCRNRAYIDADGTATKFCSHRHKRYLSFVGTAPELC